MTKGQERGEVYIFGGRGGEGNPYRDFINLELQGGSVLSRTFRIATNSPMPDGRHAGGLCSYKQWIFLFGGGKDACGPFYNDLWCFSTQASVWWRCCKPQHQNPTQHLWLHSNSQTEKLLHPPARWAHTMVTYKDSMILFGGATTQLFFNDVWVLRINVNFSQPSFCRLNLLSTSQSEISALWEKN